MRPKRIFILLLAVILALGLVSGSLAQDSSPNPSPDSAYLDRQGGTAGSGQTEAVAPADYQSIASFSEDFADITNLPGWFTQNNSDPLGLTNWFQGNDTVFPAHAGAPTAYIGANFNNTSGVGTISNWLLTPEQSLADGNTLSFWTRTVEGTLWPDRLQVRLSLAGNSTDVGSGAEDVGDFTTLLLDINPGLVVDGYPTTWTQYTITLTGIPEGSSGRLAFRYYVTNGGPSGANSNYIGIDTVEYTQVSGIALSKTVGTDPLSCAVTDEVSVVSGSQVTYCYTVENTGGVPLTLHTLEDSELGALLNDFSYTLVPGASAFITSSVQITQTTLNTAIWTAFNLGPTDMVTATDTATVTVLLPEVSLQKTVGTDPLACAATDAITVSEGTDVTYCFEVTNTGNVTLTQHTLADSELGTLLDDFNYSLTPGASVFITSTANITQTVVNTADWTAFNPGPTDVVTATDTATVTVLQPEVSLQKTVGTDPLVCAATDSISVDEGTDVTYCFEVTNTGNVTLTQHTLADSELGTLLDDFSYTLSPGASAFITSTVQITQTTVNTATWTAFNPGPVDTAEASDTATVNVTDGMFEVYLPLSFKNFLE